MRMRLMLLGGGNALGQALIRLGAEEDINFLAPRPPQDGWDAARAEGKQQEGQEESAQEPAFFHGHGWPRVFLGGIGRMESLLPDLPASGFEF